MFLQKQYILKKLIMHVHKIMTCTKLYTT